MLRFVALPMLLAVAAAPAMALDTSSNPAKPADPNRKICQKEEVTGSRLGAVKVCLTATEWADRRQAHREETERSQRNTTQPLSN